MEVEIKKCNTSVLKNNRFTSHRNDSLSPTKKKVMFESGTVKQHSHFSEHNSSISPKPISQSPGRRRLSRQSSSKSDKKIQIVNKDSGFVEVIEPNGEIKKEKIKIETSKKEFQITRNSNNAGEFSKAQEFYNKNKENSNKNFAYEVILEDEIHRFFLDFYVKDNNKVIEFDGDYWHGEKRGNQKREQERENKLKQLGFVNIIHVKECDYKADPQKVVDECIRFIKE